MLLYYNHWTSKEGSRGLYTYTPKNDTRVAAATAAICFLASILLFIPNKLDPIISTALPCTGIWLFICGFLVLERYVLTVFTYTLKACPDGCELIVTETRLKKQRVVCRVLSDSFVGLNEKVKGKKEKGTKRYNYCPELCATERYVLLIEDGDGRSEVSFRPDEKMVQIIKSLMI